MACHAWRKKEVGQPQINVCIVRLSMKNVLCMFKRERFYVIKGAYFLADVSPMCGVFLQLCVCICVCVP
jgi:hypothetical protein